MQTDATGPTVEALRTFATHSARREVGATAVALGLSAPAASRRLAELGRMPYGLVEKRGNMVVPTARGEAFLPAVTRLLRAYDQLARALAGREAAAEAVRVGAGGGLAVTPFPAAVATFRSAHPGVGVRVIGLRGRERIRAVAAGEIDLALVAHDEWQVRSAAGGADLRVEVLRDQPLMVAAAADTPDGRALAALPADRPVPPALLGTLALLGIDAQAGVRRQLGKAFPDGRVSVFPGGWVAAVACARHGVGTAVVPADAAAGSGLVTRPFPGGVKVTDRVVWADDDGPVAAFVTCLKAAFAG